MSRRNRAATKKTTRMQGQDEPEPVGDERVEWGGELMWVADWTEGGAPVGLRHEEWREAMRTGEPMAGCARALAVLEKLAGRHGGPGADVDVGRVTKIGEGLSRDVFSAEVSVRPDPDDLSGFYVVQLPRGNAEAGLEARTRKELRLLAWLHFHTLRFRVPRPLGVVADQGGLALARKFVRGIPLDLRAGHQDSVRPWQVVGEIAASLHNLEVTLLPEHVGGHSTRREHALVSLASLEGLEPAEARDGRAWALEHLPPADPPSLLHGDLLGQNILLDPGASPPFVVIDWEYALRGDPAYDLAIVTRGVRQPFQLPNGLARLLDSYAAAGGRTVTPQHVHVHELALAGHWYREALAQRRGEGHSPEETLALMRRILKAAGA